MHLVGLFIELVTMHGTCNVKKKAAAILIVVAAAAAILVSR